MSEDVVPDQSIQKAERQIPLSDRLLKLEYYDFIMAQAKFSQLRANTYHGSEVSIPGWINLFCFIRNV